MDPITRASHVFLRDAEAHWKRRRGHVLFMEADPSSRGDLVKTLRLSEQSPWCRRPLFLFEAAFIEPVSYFAALSARLASEYEALRRGAAEEGVCLHELPERSVPGDRDASAPALAGARAREIARSLEGKLEGIDIALVPVQVERPLAFCEAVTALAAELKSASARLLVLSARGGPLSDMAEGRTAHFHVDPDELAEYLKNLGSAGSAGPPAPTATPPGPDRDTAASPGGARAAHELRALLLSAGQATRRGDHAGARRLFEQARAWCAAEGRTIEEAAVVVALAGACLAAGLPERAATSYQEAIALATGAKAPALAAQAALGKGAVWMQQKRYSDAVGVYAVAAEAAGQAQAGMLEVEARRMEGTAALAAGRHGDALRAWKSAVEIGAQMDAAVRGASTWQDVVRALAALLRKSGMTVQAEHVEAQAAALAGPAPRAGAGRSAAASPHADDPPRSDLPATDGLAGADDAGATWATGPVDLSRLNVPVLPFDPVKKR
jgi:tetratricopeptide (TPR) repeat protein